MSNPNPCNTTQVPGPQGDAGANGTNGTNGVDAFTTLSAPFTMPGEGATANATVVSNAWAAPNTVVYLQLAGWLQVTAVAGANTITLLNLRNTAAGAYLDNIAPGTVLPIGALLSPGGVQGPAGALSGQAGGDLVGNYPDPTLKLLGVAGTVGDSTHVAQVTTDANGRVTTMAAVAIAFPSSGTPTGAAGGALTGNYPNPGLAAITGNTIDSTAIGAAVPATGAFTSLRANALFATPPSALQTLAAANLIVASAAKLRVVGNAAPVTMISTPTIAGGTVDGQLLLVLGTDAANTVTVQDDGTLMGSTLRLGATTRVLRKGAQLLLSWDATDAKWYEVSYLSPV